MEGCLRHHLVDLGFHTSEVLPKRREEDCEISATQDLEAAMRLWVGFVMRSRMVGLMDWWRLTEVYGGKRRMDDDVGTVRKVVIAVAIDLLIH